MDTYKVKGIVLSAVSISEKDMLVDIFTLEKGIIVAKLKSVKNINAKLKFAKEICCFGDFLISTQGNLITSLDIIDTFFDITKDINKFYCACGVLKIIKTVLKQGEVSDLLFLETLKVLGCICYDDINPLYPFCKFLITIFENMGYALSLDKCADCAQSFSGKRYLNLEFGEIVCVGCRAPISVEIPPRVHSAFRILKNTNYEKLITIKLSAGSEKECANILLQNFEYRFNKKIDVFI